MSTRTCVVTGGGTGIGLAVAARLAADGDRVVVVGRRERLLRDAAREVNERLGADRVHAEPADLTDPASVADLATRLPDRIDVLVHNAGGTLAASDGLPGTARHWLDTYALNVVSAVLLTEAVVDRLPDEEGRIVAVSSVAALRGAGAYGAAKGALDTWVTGLAAELAPRGVTVNAVAPGFVPDTEFWEGRRTTELVSQKVEGIPLGRAGTPDEVAALVAHLASVEAGFTTGQVVGIHGGTVLARL